MHPSLVLACSVALVSACVDSGCKVLQDSTTSGSFIQKVSKIGASTGQLTEEKSRHGSGEELSIDGFDGPFNGMCKRADGSNPQGSGGVLVEDTDFAAEGSPQGCADYCKSLSYCKGFNAAPGVHTRCLIWGATATHADGSWGWKCYIRHQAPTPTLIGYLPAKVGYCSMNNGEHLLGIGSIDKNSLQDCANYCNMITALRAPYPCNGFAYADITKRCNLFNSVPDAGGDDEHWLCYSRERVVEIQLHGNRHVDMEDKTWFSPNGSIADGFSIYERLQRPEWSTMVQCHGSLCAPCWGTASCWHMPQSSAGQIGRFVESDGSAGITSFINKVHIKCGAEMLWFSFMVLEVINGKLQFFWDGEEMTTEHGFEIWPVVKGAENLSVGEYNFNSDGDANFQGIAMIPVKTSGGHWFEMVFTPTSPHESSKAELASFQFLSEANYANCQDNKMCLDSLLQDDPEHQELRNSNEAQYACLMLQSPNPTSACGQWRACLENDAEEELRTMLASAFPSGTGSGSLAQVSSSTAVVSQEDAHCINPETTDPQGWACDCFEHMQSACAEREADPASGYTTLTACFTDLYCEHAEVCQDWKGAHCSDSSLLQRAQSKATKSRSSSLDSALSAKACAR